MNKIFITFCCILFLFSSCAHKSGRKKRQYTQSVNTEEDASDTERTVNKIQASPQESSGQKMDGAEIFKKYGQAVFMIFTSDGLNTYRGSGFFINSHGLAVSNYHVFEGTGVGNEQIKLEGSDTAYKVVEVLQRSEKPDFIIFKVDIDNTDYIPIAKDKPDVGEKVFAIGSPRGLENTFSSGEVSQWRDTNLMQISALIDHGSSGGALINEYGQVVGITSGSFYDGSQANLNYAWSIDVIKPYINR